MSLIYRGGVEDTKLEAKAKDTKKIRGQCQGQGQLFRGQGQGQLFRGQGQGQLFRGQNLSRPRTGVLEAKAKDTGASFLQKKRFSKIFFRRSPI